MTNVWAIQLIPGPEDVDPEEWDEEEVEDLVGDEAEIHFFHRSKVPGGLFVLPFLAF